TINYKCKGIFIAGGAGITPFIAILRHLKKQGKLEGNKLLFSNKKQGDIILEKEFKNMLGKHAIFTLTDKQERGYESGRIDKSFLKKHIDDFSQHFYICGPVAMVKDVGDALKELGANPESITIEK
ncbi:MAG: flavodoxin reductase, partial [Candidatus Nanoarchaeia archaeon]